MSTLYFADGVCNQHTHTEALGLLRAWFGKFFRIEVKPHPPVRLQFRCLEPKILAPYVMLSVMRTLRASHLDCESFHSGGLARRD